MNRTVPVTFLSNLPRRQELFSTLVQQTKAQRRYVTCKGSHSTAGREPTFHQLTSPGRGNDYITQLEGGKKGRNVSPFG